MTENVSITYIKTKIVFICIDGKEEAQFKKIM